MMIHLNFNPSLLISIFVVVLLALISPCHANANNFIFLEGFPGVGENTSNANNSMMLLAAERTRRVDPTNDFKYYEGGWDITNQHYIMSLAFSGTPFVGIAAVWCFIVAVSFTIMICCYCCCGRKKKSRTDYSRKTFAISLIFLILFLLITIIGVIFLNTGQRKFQSTTTEVSLVLVSRAKTIVDLIGDVMTNLIAAKDIKVGKFELPDDFKRSIEQVESVSNQTANIKSQAEQTAAASTQLFDAIGRSLITFGILMLILAALGFMISIFGWKFFVYILLFIGWILVTFTFVLAGISFIIQNGVADSCVAMEDWLQHPNDNTALSKILPCMDKEAAERVLVMTRNTSFQMVKLVNTFVVNVANVDVPPVQGLGDIYYNQSGPLMPILCNPFYPNLTERTCDTTEVDLKGAPGAYEGFLCNTSPSGICTTTGRLTPDLYKNFMLASNMSDTLHRHGPLLAGLADCTFVVDTFDQISKEQCPSLRRYSAQVFIGLFLISLAVMFSVILWLVFVRERRFQISANNLKKAYVEVH